MDRNVKALQAIVETMRRQQQVIEKQIELIERMLADEQQRENGTD